MPRVDSLPERSIADSVNPCEARTRPAWPIREADDAVEAERRLVLSAEPEWFVGRNEAERCVLP